MVRGREETIVGDPLHSIVISLAPGSKRGYTEITSQMSLSDANWPSAGLAPSCQGWCFLFRRDPVEK